MKRDLSAYQIHLLNAMLSREIGKLANESPNPARNRDIARLNKTINALKGELL